MTSLTTAAIKKLAEKQPQTILDVATGTGDFAIKAAEALKPAKVLGIDISEKMMEIGQQKVAARGLQDIISFKKEDCTALTLPSNSFDAVMAAFGIRNFADLDKGLAEMCRVLKPGGELMILEFSHPQNPVISALYTFYFKFVMSAFGAILTGGDIGSFTYFYHSVKRFVWGDAMLRKLEEAGFASATFQTQTFGISTIYRAVKR